MTVQDLGQRLEIDGLTLDHYDVAIAELTAARAQLVSIERGDAQALCAVCEDNDHTAEACHHNPLLLATIGAEALNGMAFRCFHCGALFTDAESATRHFGESIEVAVRCVRLGPGDARDRIRALCARTLSGGLSRAAGRRALEAILEACRDETPAAAGAE